LVASVKHTVNSEELLLCTVVLSNILTSRYKEQIIINCRCERPSFRPTHARHKKHEQRTNSSFGYDMNPDHIMQAPAIYSYCVPDTEVEFEVNLRPTVSRPVCLGVRRPSGIRDQFFFLLEIFFRQLRVCYFVPPSLTRGWVCNLPHNCFWALPEQSLLGRSPAELTAIFDCLI
jgi:hypothetical protein